MRVVLALRSFHPNIAGWIEGLKGRGHDVRVIVSLKTSKQPHGDYDLVFVENVGWLSRGLTRLFRLDSQLKVEVWRPVRLWRALAEPHPDVVLMKTQGVSTLMISLMALALRARRVSWGNQPWQRAGRWRLLARLGLMPRRHVRTTAERVGAIGSPAETRGPDRYVPYAVRLPPQVRAPRADREGPIRVLTVAEYRSPRKRPWWTLEAAARAGLLDGQLEFTFVGVGTSESPGYQRLVELVGEHDCGPLVTTRFGVPHSEMDAIYASHDLLVLPSRDEPFGMVVLEAMAHGLAVVVSDAVGAKSCVLPGDTGFVFDSHDIADLADKLRHLAEAPALLDRMGLRGRALVEAHASPDGCAQAIEEVAGVRGR